MAEFWTAGTFPINSVPLRFPSPQLEPIVFPTEVQTVLPSYFPTETPTIQQVPGEANPLLDQLNRIP